MPVAEAQFKALQTEHKVEFRKQRSLELELELAEEHRAAEERAVERSAKRLRKTGGLTRKKKKNFDSDCTFGATDSDSDLFHEFFDSFDSD